MNRLGTEGFWDNKTIQYDSKILGAWHYAFGKTHKLSNTKSKPIGSSTVTNLQSLFTILIIGKLWLRGWVHENSLYKGSKFS